MLMARISEGETRRRPCPHDFAMQFVQIGRLACEEHYRAGRYTITAWMEECGKEVLIAKRKAFVRDRYARQAERNRITRRDMRAILEQAYPVQGFVNPRLAQAAARFLQKRRNGGWIVTRAPNGMWRAGFRVLTAGELVDLAKAKGFGPNLSDDGELC